MSRTDRQHKLGGVLLAAGGSSRLGCPKQLLSIEGEILVVRMARLLLDLVAGSVVVVTGSSSQAVENQLGGLPLQIVHNSRWEEGMAGSLAAGVEILSGDLEGILIMLCDQWRVGLTDLQELVRTWKTDISRIAAAYWNDDGRRVIGPPAIFPKTLFEELTSLKGDRGARSVIEKHRDGAAFVALENARFDLDEPADLEKIPGWP